MKWWKELTKTTKIIVGSILLVATFSTLIWGAAVKWKDRCYLEQMHEQAQDARDVQLKEEIEENRLQIAFNARQNQLSILQQRIFWLQQQIVALERDYGGRGVPQAPHSVKSMYADFITEYDKRMREANALMGK
jgi:hypothetical protein